MAERKHRRIIETAITLITTTHLPQSLWFHACALSVFLINRMPSKTLGMQSPYQLLFGDNHQLQGIKIFETAMY